MVLALPAKSIQDREREEGIRKAAAEEESNRLFELEFQRAFDELREEREELELEQALQQAFDAESEKDEEEDETDSLVGDGRDGATDSFFGEDSGQDKTEKVPEDDDEDKWKGIFFEEEDSEAIPTTEAPDTTESSTARPFCGLALPKYTRKPTPERPVDNLALPKDHGVSESERKRSEAASSLPTPGYTPEPQANLTDDHEDIQEPAKAAGKKRRRELAEERCLKRQKREQDYQFRCRYGCTGRIKDKAALKAHAEKVHNLFYAGQSRAKCHFCNKMFRDPKDKERHDNSNDMCTLRLAHRGPPLNWKVPAPHTRQQCADTWGMTIHGEVSEYLRDLTSDDLLPEHQIDHCKGANIEEVPKIEDTHVQNQPATQGTQDVITIDEDNNNSTDIQRIFNDTLNWLNGIADLPDAVDHMPPWLREEAGLKIDSLPVRDNGHSIDDPIELD